MVTETASTRAAVLRTGRAASFAVRPKATRTVEAAASGNRATERVAEGDEGARRVPRRVVVCALRGHRPGRRSRERQCWRGPGRFTLRRPAPTATQRRMITPDTMPLAYDAAGTLFLR